MEIHADTARHEGGVANPKGPGRRCVVKSRGRRCHHERITEIVQAGWLIAAQYGSNRLVNEACLLLLLQCVTTGTRRRSHAERILAIRQTNAAALHETVEGVAIEILKRLRRVVDIIELESETGSMTGW